MNKLDIYKTPGEMARAYFDINDLLFEHIVQVVANSYGANIELDISKDKFLDEYERACHISDTAKKLKIDLNKELDND